MIALPGGKSKTYFLLNSEETVNTFLPFARREAKMRRPLAVAIRSRNPCLFLRFVFDGWNVLFIAVMFYVLFFIPIFGATKIRFFFYIQTVLPIFIIKRISGQFIRCKFIRYKW
jgi:hypothetical protein